MPIRFDLQVRRETQQLLARKLLAHHNLAAQVVCNPRKNALLKDGNKSDRIDADKLAELLYLNKLSSVYHGETGVRMLRELAELGHMRLQ